MYCVWSRVDSMIIPSPHVLTYFPAIVLAIVLCGRWPQWPSVILFVSFPGPNPHLRYIPPIRTHKYPPRPSANIRGPHDHACHVLCILRCVCSVGRLCLRARLTCLLGCFGGFASYPNPKPWPQTTQFIFFYSFTNFLEFFYARWFSFLSQNPHVHVIIDLKINACVDMI